MAMFLGRKSRVESAAYLPQQAARLGQDFGLQGPVLYFPTLISGRRVKFISY